jgi:hypothetical protein
MAGDSAGCGLEVQEVDGEVPRPAYAGAPRRPDDVRAIPVGMKIGGWDDKFVTRRASP